MIRRFRTRFSAGYRNGDVRDMLNTGVFKCTRHCHTVIEEQLKLCFSQILHIIRVIGEWFVLKERKRKLNPVPVNTRCQFPKLDQASFGEPAKKYYKITNPKRTDLGYEMKSDGFDNHSKAQSSMMQEHRIVIGRRLSILPRRIRGQKISDLSNIEDQNAEFNDISRQKVENWLARHFTSMDQNVSYAHKMAMSRQQDNYDEMILRKNQNATLSNKDDEDSLLSVDTAKYILSNRKKNNISSKVRTTTTIQQFALASSRTSNTKLPIMNFARNISRTAPTAIHNEFKRERSKGFNNKHVPPSTLLTPDKEKKRKRKKVFKKTVKKKILSCRKSSSSKASNASREFEQALQKSDRVRKMPVIKPGKRKIHWIESNQKKNETDSTSSSEDEIFAKNNLKRGRRRGRRRSVTLERNESSQWIEEPSNSNTLRRATSNTHIMQQKPIDFNLHNEHSNWSTSFTAESDNIINSTEINNVTFGSASMNTSAKTSTYRPNSFYDPNRSVLVYTPKQIKPSLPLSARIRITVKDLDLSQVTKPHHLLKFQKFNYLIHPNSTVRFYPSDFEDDLPKPVLSAKLLKMIAEESESFDDDDPLLVYNPRNLNRFNLREIPYNYD